MPLFSPFFAIIIAAFRRYFATSRRHADAIHARRHMLMIFRRLISMPPAIISAIIFAFHHYFRLPAFDEQARRRAAAEFRH
jgi:hypothetical protein